MRGMRSAPLLAGFPLVLVLATLLPAQLPPGAQAPLGPVASESARSRFFERIGATVVGRSTRPEAFVFGEQRLEVDRDLKAPHPGPRVLLVPSLGLLPQQLAQAGLDATPLHIAGEATPRALSVKGPAELVVILREARAQGQTALPRAEDFARHVLAVMESYPADGTHAYHWPKSGGWKGCTKDLVYGDGEIIAEGDAKGRAYCCGLTFEVFVEAWRAWSVEQGRVFRVGDRDVAGMRKLQTDWFGSAKDISCVHTAIVGGKLGRRIEKLEDARPGDFVQLWRHSGSGHSVIFLGWERAGDRITGLRYWSTQKSTQGIGTRTEMFGDHGKALDVEKLWICRVGG